MRDSTLFVTPLVLLDPPAVVLAPQPSEETIAVSGNWPHAEPALRYAVASLDHWLDLNA